MAYLMRTAPRGYVLGKCLHRTRHAAVYEGTRIDDGLPVVFKHYLQPRGLNGELDVDREFRTLRRISSSRVTKALEVDPSAELPSLILERVPGIPLLRMIQDEPLTLDLWLSVAVQIAEALDHVHAAGLLHRDLTPAKIMLDPESTRAWIIGFGRACDLGASERLGGTDPWFGTLRYIAPEQTGRMNRGCDFRSDLYSFGATLYHALCGHPPFESEDALELLHSHMARIPPSPSQARPGLPDAICGLVLKLLSKEPLDRYQSAKALHSDLRACLEQLERFGAVASEFELSDQPTRPHFSSKLYSREAELAKLTTLYEQASQGERQLVLLSGDPGVGKSALVDCLRSEIASTRGYLASSKFDRYKERAYAGWVDALDSLVQQILMESDADLERWRTDLRAGLGNIAQALVDVIPDMTFILGEVPSIPLLGPTETLARLSLALQRFVSVVATPERPLVLQLDDLQWSDSGSLVLL